MHTQQLLKALTEAGMAVSLTHDRNLKVTPAKSLTEELRNSIRAHKANLVEFLQRQAANDPTPDADRWCWPASSAMTGNEIELFGRRADHFLYKHGLSVAQVEDLADKLVIRDREGDDRRLCIECRHLRTYGHGSWHCAAWRTADAAIRASDARLPTDFVSLMQRCPGFQHELRPTGGGNEARSPPTIA